MERLKVRRLRSWYQDGVHRVGDSVAAESLIDRLGLVTHYAASPEVANLFWAYVSQPNARAEASWDSPAGQIYPWRWEIGRREAAFYGTVAAKKPTWIAWRLLAPVLGFAMERRNPETLYADGLLSNDAIRIFRAFDGTSGTLSTKDLRQRAGFPTGKEERQSYLKAVEELDSRLLLAKVFSTEGEGEEMNHALVSVKYAAAVQEAMSTTPDEALVQFLGEYLAGAIYLDPRMLARHLRVDANKMQAAGERLIGQGRALAFDKFWVTTKEEKE